MAPARLTLSQEEFDAAVQEAMEIFGIDEKESIEDTKKTFEMQGFDLSGIITAPDQQEHPIVAASTRLSNAVTGYLQTATENSGIGEADVSNGGRVVEKGNEALIDALVKAIEDVEAMMREGGADTVSVAGRLGVVESTVKACDAFLQGRQSHFVEKGLAALNLLLTDEANKQAFLKANGPDVVVTALSAHQEFPSLVHAAANVAATAGTRFEVNKEEFMNRNAHELLVGLMRRHLTHSGAVQGSVDALRSLSTNDDSRVAASKTFTNAQKIAEAGAVEAILEAAREHREDPQLSAILCTGLKAVAVNEDICRSVAEKGGVELAINFLSVASAERRASIVRSACGLLRQLAGSDRNKAAIVEGGGMNHILGASSIFPEDPGVIQESFATVTALTLRMPGHAAIALQLGAASVAAEAMERHSSAGAMQRQACQMLRNLAVRNPESRSLILEAGVEPLLREAKARHKQCQDVALAALMALGFDN